MTCSYTVEMQTSDVRRAGTKGSVYLTIIGDAGAVGERFLLVHAWICILDRIIAATGFDSYCTCAFT